MTAVNTQSESIRKPDESRLTGSASILIGALVWIGALMLYAYTSAPGIVELFDDSLEFQTVVPTFGIAHPTGYPLYTLTGGVWSRLLFPFGNWAWRMNIFSALAAATTVLLVYLIAGRLVPEVNRRSAVWMGLTAAAAFALGPVWWRQATVAEVYALHNLFVAAILLTTLTIPPHLNETLSPEHQSKGLSRMMFLFFLTGLSLAHHRTTLLLVPGVAVYLLWSVPGLWRPRKEWLFWIVAFFVPLTLYLYLPARAAQGAFDLNDSYLNTVEGFLNHVLARGYTTFFADSTLGALHTVSDALRLFWEQLGLVATALAISGLIAMPFLGETARKNWSLLFLVLAANLGFGLRYQVADWQVFLIPVTLVLALYAGAGIGILASWLSDRPRMATIAAAVLTLLVLAGVTGRGVPVDRRDDWDAHQYAYLLGTVDYPVGSRVIGLEGETTALKYMQAAEKMAANAIPVTADLPAARATAIADSVDAGKATYITRELPGIEEQYSFGGDGPLVQVWPRGQAGANKSENLLNAELLEGRLRLEGYEVRALELPGGPVLELTLDWLPVESLARTIKVSLRLQDSQSNPVLDASGDPIIVDEFPVRQVAPSTAWLPGELLRDVHHIPVPPAGVATKLQVIVYDAATVDELGRYDLPIP